MKLLLLLTAVLVSGAFAADTELGYLGKPDIVPDPQTDADICNQVFDFGALQNGLSVSSCFDRMMADDFTSAIDSDMGLIELWIIYTDVMPASILFQIRDDNSSSPGSTVEWSADVSDLTHTNTGFTSWGYIIWHTEAVLTPAEYFTPIIGVKYWFVVQTQTTTNDFWLCRNQFWADMSYFSENNGTTWMSSFDMWGAAYEQFMILSTPVALDHSTWGDIKTLF